MNRNKKGFNILFFGVFAYSYSKQFIEFSFIEEKKIDGYSSNKNYLTWFTAEETDINIVTRKEK